jgi:sterol 24-C-methyltransferase
MYHTLSYKLARIKSLFDIDAFLIKSSDIEGIQDYYKKNKKAYKWIHDANGFVHMGLSKTGKYNKNDTFAQAELVNNLIVNNHFQDVLELGGGTGANSLYLSKKFPGVRFTVTDLPKGQFDPVHVSKYANTNLVAEFMDYHNLYSYKEKSFDLVFVIEALCHSEKKANVFEEVRRVLKPNGLFVVFDGYASLPEGELGKDVLTLKKLLEKGMAVTRFETLTEVSSYAVNAGFTCTFEQDVTKQIIPTAKRYEWLAKNALFRHNILGKFLLKVFNDRFLSTAVSGYLMYDLILAGIFKYSINVFKVPES